MSISAVSGPLVQFGQSPYAAQEYNGDRAPAVFDQGTMLLDPRTPFTYLPGGAITSAAYGFMAGGELIVVDAAPAALAANNIAASQSPAAGAITLVSSTAAGITVGVSIIRADTGATVTGLLAIDGAMGTLAMNPNSSVVAWDPAKAISRAVRIVSGGNDSGIVFTVNGYDIFGYPMTEAITGANAGTATGKKAFKYISSVTHTGSVATTVTIGTTDVYGFPLRVDRYFYTYVVWNNAAVASTATGTFAFADTTSPATTTTGDVRGTYLVSSASDGTKRLQIAVSVPPANAGTVAGVFGVTQV